MNAEKLITMVFRMLTRKLVNKGVDASINHMPKGTKRSAKHAKRAARQARKARRMAGL